MVLPNHASTANRSVQLHLLASVPGNQVGALAAATLRRGRAAAEP